MTKRLSDRFEKCRLENRAALVSFTMAGDPTPEASLEILKALPEAGADIVEFGMPFSDPLADGPSVQEAGIRALKNHVPLSKTLDMVQEFRKTNQETPVILMGYYNPIYRYGPEKFIKDAEQSGVDGLIIVDLPAEMDVELTDHAMKAGVDPVRLITPTTDDKRLETVLKNTRGFLYYVSIKGVTGAKLADFSEVETSVKHLKEKTALPIAVGFGIKTKEDAETVGRFADGVVVGSRLVDTIKASLDENGQMTEQTLPSVSSVINELAEGVKTARK